MMLAAHLGMTVEELRDRMTSAELTEWRAWYELEPWGEEREDIRTAALMEIIGATFGGKLSRRKAFNSLRMHGEQMPEQTEEEMKAVLRMLG